MPRAPFSQRSPAVGRDAASRHVAQHVRHGRLQHAEASLLQDGDALLARRQHVRTVEDGDGPADRPRAVGRHAVVVPQDDGPVQRGQPQAAFAGRRGRIEMAREGPAIAVIPPAVLVSGQADLGRPDVQDLAVVEHAEDRQRDAPAVRRRRQRDRRLHAVAAPEDGGAAGQQQRAVAVVRDDADGTGTVFLYAAVRAQLPQPPRDRLGDPDIAFGIAGHRVAVLAGVDGDPRHLVRAQAVQPILGAEPDIPGTVFEQAVHGRGGEGREARGRDALLRHCGAGKQAGAAARAVDAPQVAVAVELSARTRLDMVGAARTRQQARRRRRRRFDEHRQGLAGARCLRQRPHAAIRRLGEARHGRRARYPAQALGRTVEQVDALRTGRPDAAVLVGQHRVHAAAGRCHIVGIGGIGRNALPAPVRHAPQAGAGGDPGGTVSIEGERKREADAFTRPFGGDVLEDPATQHEDAARIIGDPQRAVGTRRQHVDAGRHPRHGRQREALELDAVELVQAVLAAEPQQAVRGLRHAADVDRRAVLGPPCRVSIVGLRGRGARRQQQEGAREDNAAQQ